MKSAYVLVLIIAIIVLAQIANAESVNLALNAATIASSNHNEQKTPAHAVDGDHTTFWSSGGAVPRWWQVDLSDVYRIDSIFIRIRGDANPLCYSNPCYDFSISGSLDSTTWVSLVDEYSTTSASYTYYPVPNQFRYFRVDFTMSNDWASWVNIVEFESYGGCCIGNRGDLNGDGDDANILDLTHLVDFIFRGSGDPGPCPAESDINGDGNPNSILDLTFLIDVIFRGGTAPSACP